MCWWFVTRLVVHSYSGGYQITKEKMTINEIEILEDHFYYIPSVWLMMTLLLLLLVLALRRLLLPMWCLHHHQCSSFAAVAAAVLLMP